MGKVSKIFKSQTECIIFIITSMCRVEKLIIIFDFLSLSFFFLHTPEPGVPPTSAEETPIRVHLPSAGFLGLNRLLGPQTCLCHKRWMTS